MRFLKRNIQLVDSPLSILVVVLVAILGFTGCNKKKKDNLMPLAIGMFAGGSSQSSNEGRPYAVTYTPRDGDTNVSLNVVGTVTFNKPMDVNTITIVGKVTGIYPWQYPGNTKYASRSRP